MDPSRGEPDPPASVIVPCFGQLEYTRHCVAALARHTRLGCELAAVDRERPTVAKKIDQGVYNDNTRALSQLQVALVESIKSLSRGVPIRLQ